MSGIHRMESWRSTKGYKKNPVNSKSFFPEQEEAGGYGSMPVLKSLMIRYAVVTGVIFGFILALFLVAEISLIRDLAGLPTGTKENICKF